MGDGERDSIDRDLPEHWFRYHTDEGDEVRSDLLFAMKT